MKQKIRILWVTNAFGCGGAERQMIYMYDILSRYCDYDIRILYYAHVKDELPLGDMKTVFIDKQKVGRLKTILTIADYIKKNDISIMHAFGGCSANIYGRAGAMLSKKTIPIGAMLGKKHFSSLASRIMNSLLNLKGNWWTVNNVELIPILRKDLKFTTPERIRMLHNGFVSDTEINYHINEVTDYDKDKGDNFVFCTVGRLQPVKNIQLLINAASKIFKTHNNVRFWVIGNGEEYYHLQKQIDELGIAGKVKLWGYRSDIDVALSRADVYVQTSITEGSPNTIAEAMRASKPIISTNCTDLSEMIDNGNNGFIVKNNDLDSLVNAMNKIIDIPDDNRKQLGEKSKEMFTKTFLDKNVVKEFESLYNQVLG
ncbi:glycosyltransferase [Clostridiales bacterium FE2011]|nr:glycosyltransferase [Clostridiales bacterium FE2011]